MSGEWHCNIAYRVLLLRIATHLDEVLRNMKLYTCVTPVITRIYTVYATKCALSRVGALANCVSALANARDTT